MGEAVRLAVNEVLQSHAFVLGPVVEGFEHALARYLDVPHVVGVGSGTDALYLAMVAAGIGPGDAVLTSPFSFVASASAIARTGARPYFADIDPASFNLDPMATGRWLRDDCRRVEGRLRAPGGEIVRGLLPVHLFGRPCAIEVFRELAAEYELALIEDAAQAIGARLPTTGRSAGTFGRFGCFSFYPTKNLGAAGDGGCVVCLDEADAAALRMRARHGVDGDPYRHVVAGRGLADSMRCRRRCWEPSCRMSIRWNAARRAVAERYDTLLAADPVPSPTTVRRPALTPGHVFHHYVVRVRERDRVRSGLAAGGDRDAGLLSDSPPCAAVLRDARSSASGVSRGRSCESRMPGASHAPRACGRAGRRGCERARACRSARPRRRQCSAVRCAC